MTFAEIIDDLKNLIGPGIEVDDDGLKNWVNDAYMDFVDEIIKADPDYFIKSATTSTVASQQEYNLSSLDPSFDKIAMVNIAYDGSTWRRAVPMGNADARFIESLQSGETPGFTQGSPQYYILGQNLGFAPIPDANGSNNIKIWYVYTPDILSADSDTPAFSKKYHRLLKFGAYANYLDQDDEHVAAERMRLRYERRMGEAVESIVTRQTDVTASVELSANQGFYTADTSVVVTV